MQGWLDLCLSKDVGPGLGSCDSDGGSAYLAALPWGKLRKPNHVRRKPGGVTCRCSHILTYFVWKTTSSLNRNDRCCLLQAFLQFSTSPASLNCPLYVLNYLQKVKLAAENVARVIKTSDKYWKLLALVKITSQETFGTFCSSPLGQMVWKFLLQLV